MRYRFVSAMRLGLTRRLVELVGKPPLRKAEAAFGAEIGTDEVADTLAREWHLSSFTKGFVALWHATECGGGGGGVRGEGQGLQWKRAPLC